MPFIELTEYQSLCVPRNEIPESVVDELKQQYRGQLEVDLQYTKTGDRWQLTSKGWVGHIPLTPNFHFILYPKVPLFSLFGMLEYAYNFQIFDVSGRLIDCQSLEDFYSELALVLAKRILDRCRKGISRAYVPKTGQLAYLRGRLNVRQAIQKPWDIKLSCDYEEYTSDIGDNQILAWTLHCIMRSRICQERVLPTVRQAYHTLQGFVTIKQFKAEDCVRHQYNRLNEDYRALHALCHFFLKNTAPSHQLGNRTMLPFLVDMARLYERFVAQWLKAHPPQGFFVRQQVAVKIDQNRHFRIDLLLCDVDTGAARYVLDTKYKDAKRAEDADIHQMVSYATATQCREAVLIYPKPLKEPLDIKNHDIRVRSLSFSLDSELDRAGKAFLQDLFEDSFCHKGLVHHDECQ